MYAAGITLSCTLLPPSVEYQLYTSDVVKAYSITSILNHSLRIFAKCTYYYSVRVMHIG